MMNKKNDSFTCDTQGRQEKDLLEDSFGYKVWKPTEGNREILNMILHYSSLNEFKKSYDSTLSVGS